MADIFLMIGVPGSGKTTYAKKMLSNVTIPTEYVSRDEIRFSLLKPGNKYFSKEKETQKLFWERINNALSEEKSVIIDQTSLTPRARQWLFIHIDKNKYKHIHAIWMDVPLEECLRRNKTREGRAFVPPDTIKSMYHNFIPPSYDEGFTTILKNNGEDDSLTFVFDKD